jgi:hypothetical protein
MGTCRAIIACLEGPEEELGCLVLAGAWLQLNVLLLLLMPDLLGLCFPISI